MVPWYLGNSRGDFGHEWMAPLGFLAIWSLVWTGLAVWHAARREEKGWFIFFLLVHTGGILEILYLIFVVRAFASSKKSAKKRRLS